MVSAALFATRTRALSLALTVVASTAGRGALGAETTAPVPSARLDVEAPSECATRADLMARVRARSPRVSFVDDPASLAIRAQFSVQASGSITGDLTLARPGATTTTRRVVARSCSEAQDALALMIAVTLDPTSAEPRSDASAPNAPTDEPSKPLPQPVATTATPVPPDAQEEPEEPSGPPLRMTPRFDLTLAAQSFVGPAPGLMPGVSLYWLAGLDRPSPLSPALIVGFTHAWRTDVEEQGGTASFLLDAVSLDACPLRVTLPRTELRPCAAVLGGRLTARGADTLNPVDEIQRPFWVLGASAVVTVRLVWNLEASARLGVGGNLVQDAFRFGSNTFHTVGDVTVAGSVGVGLRLP